jgi:hypothetical protein
MTKEHFKHYLRHSGLAYITAEALYENALYVPSVGRHALSTVGDALRRAVFGASSAQPIITWNVPFPPFDRAADLIAWLRVQGVEVSEGGHTFYIPPQAAVRRIVPAIADFYPEGSGFKVLKDLRDPVRARYIFKHPRSLRMLKTLIGAPRDQMVAANYMHALGIGPRVWDICCWTARGKQCTAFVVEHVAGHEPSYEQSLAFLAQLKDLSAGSHLRILAPRWRDTIDFQPPDCNRNLLYSEALGRAQYVDFQNFGLKDRGAWRREMAVGGTWRKAVASLSRALRDAAIDLGGRLVLDVACGGGLKVYAALAGGAMWVQGWDRAEMTARATQRVFAHGAGRFSLVAADPDEPRDLLADVPRRLWPLLPRAVVFCPASRARLLAHLFAMSWSALVCEGEASQSPEAVVSGLQSLARRSGSDGLDVLATARIIGESGSRSPLVVVRREAGGSIPAGSEHAG